VGPSAQSNCIVRIRMACWLSSRPI